MKGVCFRVNEWVFCSIVLYRPALDGTIVQGSNLECLESDAGAIKWMLFCICMSVCLSLREQRKSCTFMKLQCILIMLHISYILCHIM